ncbi:Sarcoplasmic calcium-binding protein [Lamellibrachia satsuma]|nr:Sarcoplasmic calcium-binding protein [Lamellibrachia satsuma]
MSDFWKRKMKTYFNRIDFDKDGAITRADFEGMANRFNETGKLTSDRQADMMTTLTDVWDKYLSVLGGGTAIHQSQFVELMEKLINDPTMKDVVKGPLPLFFHCVDSNDDHLIDEAEYKKFFEILGLDTSLATAAFQAIDTNKDGNISLDEFTDAGSLFFITQEDNCPNSLFWGPLE